MKLRFIRIVVAVMSLLAVTGQASAQNYREHFVSGVTAAMTGTSDTAVIAAQGAGIRLYITTITVSNSHVTTGTVVNIKDGTTTIWTVNTPANSVAETITFSVPLRLSANAALNCANVTTGSNTFCAAAGYRSAE